MSMQPTTPAPIAPTGRILTVTDSQGQDTQGNWVRGKTVTYQLTTGQTGTVFIPNAIYNSDTVTAAVKDAAQQMVDILNMTF